MLPRVCRHCDEDDESKLVKNDKEATGRERLCIKCQSLSNKRRLDEIGPALITHHVDCWRGCNGIVKVKTMPGEIPSKYQTCKSCLKIVRKNSSGLLHGIYPDHGDNSDSLRERAQTI